jgi:hypothetical protein
MALDIGGMRKAAIASARHNKLWPFARHPEAAAHAVAAPQISSQSSASSGIRIGER